MKEDDLESYFAHFGRVTCVNIMYDKNSGRHRGFAFVDFNDYDPVDKVLCKVLSSSLYLLFSTFALPEIF